jgi:hypothetical protein
VTICAEIPSKARSDEKSLLFVHCDDGPGFVVSLAVAVGGSSGSSARGLFDSAFGGGGSFVVCFLFLFEADGALGFVVVVPTTSSGVAATLRLARVVSNSVWSSIARARHAAHSSDIGLVAERQK